MANSGRGPETPNGVPEIDPSALRDYAPSAEVDRVWRRLDAELHGAQLHDRSRPRLPVSANESRWQRRGYGWAVAVAAVTFGAGIWIGRHTASSELREVAFLSREPSASGARGPDATRPERGGQGRGNLGRDDLGRDGQSRSESARDGLSDPKRATNGEHSSAPSTLDSVSPGRYGLGLTPPHGTDRISPDADEAVVPLAPELAGPPELTGPLADESPALGPVAELAPSPAPAGPNASPSWQRFANAGEYETALFILGQNGGFEKALSEADAEQLMLLSDVAWATGQRQRSISALRRVVQEFSAEPAAPLAAWSLAKQLEKVGDKQGALKAFADYRALSPEGDFAEDALVRQMKDAAERGDQARLKELASQYDVQFTDGRRAADVARWLSRSTDGNLPDAGVEALTQETEESVPEDRPAPAAKKTSSGEKSESASAPDKSADKKAEQNSAEKTSSEKSPAEKGSGKSGDKSKAQDSAGDKPPSKTESSSK